MEIPWNLMIKTPQEHLGILDTNYDEVKKISKIHENSGKKDGIYDKQLFVDLSSYYNQADMKIGAGISFVTATLRYMGTTNKTTEAQNEG